jgi:Lsr2
MVRLQLTLISSIGDTVTPGTPCAIDFSDAIAKKLRGAPDGYISKSRKVSGKRSTTRKASSTVDLKASCAWAGSNGVELSSRGRVSASLLDQSGAPATEARETEETV